MVAERLPSNVTATVRSERAGYLYLFNVDVDGEVTCLFPNKSQSNNKIEANIDVVVPDPNKPERRPRETFIRRLPRPAPRGPRSASSACDSRANPRRCLTQ